MGKIWGEEREGLSSGVASLGSYHKVYLPGEFGLNAVVGHFPKIHEFLSSIPSNAG